MRISFIEEMSGGIFYVGSMQYLFFSGAEVWTQIFTFARQVLYLKPVHQSFFVLGIFKRGPLKLFA
jgi:hypothetical protein